MHFLFQSFHFIIFIVYKSLYFLEYINYNYVKSLSADSNIWINCKAVLYFFNLTLNHVRISSHFFLKLGILYFKILEALHGVNLPSKMIHPSSIGQTE